MLRLALAAIVLCAVFFGLQSRADACGPCGPRGGDAPAATAAADADGHSHHAAHDTPHVPHDEPDGCRHDCAGCSSATPLLAALAVTCLLPEPAPAGLEPLAGECIPCGPSPSTPFQVPRS